MVEGAEKQETEETRGEGTPPFPGEVDRSRRKKVAAVCVRRWQQPFLLEE